MKFEFEFAKRYLIAKKSHNAINIISLISLLGVVVGSMSLIIVLSVFNGFSSVISTLYSAVDPDLRIENVNGKIFNSDNDTIVMALSSEEILFHSFILKEQALAWYDNRQSPVEIIGVDSTFLNVTGLDSVTVSGTFKVEDKDFEYCVAGYSLVKTLGANPKFVKPIRIYAPRRKGEISLMDPTSGFIESYAFLSGVFMIQQPEYDSKNMYVSINHARKLFEYDLGVSSVEIKLKDYGNLNSEKKRLRKILGNQFKVLDRHEQKLEFYRMMQIEKWMTFLILAFILMIAIFNIIGTLSMLIIDKKNDIITLRNLGADDRTIQRIFMVEGWIISVFGALMGIIIGTIFVFIQKYFGIITLGGGDNFIINAYPVLYKMSDSFLVFFTVLVLGIVASQYPSKVLVKRYLNK